MKLVKRLSLVALVSTFALTVAGCGGREVPVVKNGISINFATGNSLNNITYNTGNTLNTGDGNIYTNGNLKPVWNKITKDLDIQLTDNTTPGQKAVDMINTQAATQFSGSTIYAGAAAEDFMFYGSTSNLFIDLNDHKDALPDFFEFLEDYPTIKTSITAQDGGLYYIPYVAEQDEFSKVFFGRESWVNYLLDDTKVKASESLTLTTNYEGYWKGDIARTSSNVIELQNAAATNGKLDGATALNVLLTYIEANYDLESPADLYLGANAQYDIDELVALWRVIKLHPKSLSKLTTGQEIASCDIIPYFFRTKNNREDIFKLISYFGGTRVYGTNTNVGKWYIDADNNLQYTFAQEELYEGIDHLKDIYAEGLINPDYDNVNSSSNYRTLLYGSDKLVDNNGNSTVKSLGFMTFDFIPSTASSAASGDVEAFLPPLTTLQGDNSGEFHHFIEIPRTIMNNGWAISSKSSAEEIQNALKLFNYFFTEEGYLVQNFGIDGLTADFDDLYTTEKGDEVPTLLPWLQEQADIYTGGDITSFGVNYLGIRLGVGYVADIGYEMQYMNETAFESYSLYTPVKTLSYSSENNLMKLSPPCYSFTEAEKRQLSMFNVGDPQMTDTFQYIKGTGNVTLESIKKKYADNGLVDFIKIYQTAYNRVK